MSERDNPGIHLPPPFIYVAGVVVAIGLHRLAPLRLPLPEAWTTVAGWIVIAPCFVLFGAGLVEFVRNRTSVLPDRAANRLITGGIFRLTRNPLYLAGCFAQGGAGIAVNNLWIVVMLVPVVWAVNRFIIPREERYLTRRFGRDYIDYASRVRRWI